MSGRTARTIAPTRRRSCPAASCAPAASAAPSCDRCGWVYPHRIAGLRRNRDPPRHAAPAAVGRRQLQRIAVNRPILSHKRGRVPPPERRLRVHSPQQTRHLADPQLDLRPKQRQRSGGAAAPCFRQQPQVLGECSLNRVGVHLVGPPPLRSSLQDLLHSRRPRPWPISNRYQHRSSQRMRQQLVPQQDPAVGRVDIIRIKAEWRRRLVTIRVDAERNGNVVQVPQQRNLGRAGIGSVKSTGAHASSTV